MSGRQPDPDPSADPERVPDKTRSGNDDHGPPADGLFLDGAVFAFTGPRRHEEIKALVEHRKGVAYFAPTVEITEDRNEDEVRAFAQVLAAGRFVGLVFLTGQAARDFYASCEEFKLLQKVVEASKKIPVFARGTKAMARARARGVEATHITSTVAELNALLKTAELRPGEVGVVQYGLRDKSVPDTIKSRGLLVRELHLYNSSVPGDRRKVIQMYRDLVDGRIQVISFTSAIGVYNFFSMAVAGDGEKQVREALERVVIAATGPVTADALRDHGIEPQVVPTDYKLPAMVKAVADYMQRG
ncbi:MAG TPA: uroporphyrinogen-III synthase [Thermoplasmata archaeon]|nr:uroporphyrinogen-III synthase [Thermoplasmata archaeon]